MLAGCLSRTGFPRSGLVLIALCWTSRFAGPDLDLSHIYHQILSTLELSLAILGLGSSKLGVPHVLAASLADLQRVAIHDYGGFLPLLRGKSLQRSLGPGHRTKLELIDGRPPHQTLVAGLCSASYPFARAAPQLQRRSAELRARLSLSGDFLPRPHGIS